MLTVDFKMLSPIHVDARHPLSLSHFVDDHMTRQRPRKQSGLPGREGIGEGPRGAVVIGIGSATEHAGAAHVTFGPTVMILRERGGAARRDGESKFGFCRVSQNPLSARK